MFVLEFKSYGKTTQYQAIEEAIRTVQFIRNKCLRYWMDNRGVGQKALYAYSTVLRKEFAFVENLNSMACQASAERSWSAISRFYDNCKKAVKGKKGYPKFKKNCRSVEYKTSGWKLSEDRKKMTFTDRKGIGTLKLKGTRDLNYFQIEQIKRVRIVRRADGYYVQFILSKDARDGAKIYQPTGKAVGIDVGLEYFYADSNGYLEENPRFYRQAEKLLNKLNRRKSRKYRNPGKGKKGVKMVKAPNLKQSNNYHKARSRSGKAHLKVSRQREEFAKRVALRLIQSNDLVAYEDLNVRNMVRNHCLAKSISDAGWSSFRRWLEYFGWKYGKATVAVLAHGTSQRCSNCGNEVFKTLSQRTHKCDQCGYCAQRDVNSGREILRLGLRTVGHTGNHAWGDLPSSLVGEILLGYGESLNQESLIPLG